MLPAAAAALFRRQPDVRDHHLLAFEARERDVDAADRHLATGAILDLAADGRAVGAVSQAQQREQHQLLEFSENGGVVVFDMYHSFKYMTSKSSIFALPPNARARIIVASTLHRASFLRPARAQRKELLNGLRIFR